jgi:hypothetical protein
MDVLCGPAPLRTTLPRLQYAVIPVNVPAGIRTTVFDGAEAHAAAMLEVVTVPPYNVLQALVLQFAQFALGIPPGIPAYVQLAARAGARTPDHSCPYTNAEDKSNIKIRGRKYALARLIDLCLQTTC